MFSASPSPLSQTEGEGEVKILLGIIIAGLFMSGSKKKVLQRGNMYYLSEILSKNL
jgi:hypothetical protein